jgi:hypothetical protein
LRANKTLIHSSFYVSDNWRNYLNNKNVQYSEIKKMFTEMAKSIRIIGDPDNQRPDEWSSTVIVQPSASTRRQLTVTYAT